MAAIRRFMAKLPQRTRSSRQGVVTFTHFTCQPPCALKDRKEENQLVRALDVGANSTENGLFLASVTTPDKLILARPRKHHRSVLALKLSRPQEYGRNYPSPRPAPAR